MHTLLIHSYVTYFSTKASRIVVADPVVRRPTAVGESSFCHWFVEARPVVACVSKILTDLRIMQEVT